MERIKIGVAFTSDNICEFKIWAPLAMYIELKFIYPVEYTVSMEKDKYGYWSKNLNGIHPGFRYFFLVDGTVQRPDPASSYQPEGVHGPSEVADHRKFTWSDAGWKTCRLSKMIIYEIHTGTFTPEGTFDAIIPRLESLKKLGITTIELMPVAQFPGGRNWGYDGVYPYAVQNSYGGPDGLKRLCDACHRTGIALFLDVVYNHLGPEGNYLSAYGPYFTDRYRTPWGDAVNFDGEYSDGVRNYFIMNALHWFDNYHIDGLRLDAVHGIFDMSAKHILEELEEAVRDFSASKEKTHFLIAESDLNDSRIVRMKNHGGFGLDTQWNDDFHHSIHTLLTGETDRHYRDFGKISDIGKAFTEGYVFTGDYSPYRKKRHGNSSADLPGSRFTVFIQNHDQVGNRIHGERITMLSGFEAHKLAAGTMLVSPYIPLLFMGEEYAETSPFLYFISHEDPELADAVASGRKREFSSHISGDDPPDPRRRETFDSSMPDNTLAFREPHTSMLNYYRQLIMIRKNTPAISHLVKKNTSVESDEQKKTVILHRTFRNSCICALMNFNNSETNCFPGSNNGRLIKIIDSAAKEWNGPGASAPETIDKKTEIILKPFNFIIYSPEKSK